MDIDVALCGDRDVILGMAVSGRSALEHANSTVNFWVICQDFTDDDKDKLRQSWSHERLGKIAFTDISRDKLINFRSTSYLKSKVAYARYYVADFFPHLTRCIYLDTDLLVMRDLGEAMALDLGDNALAAVLDVGVRVNHEGKIHQKRLGLSSAEKYFNSGFLVIDLRYWRDNNVTSQIIDLSIKKKDILNSQDQDALNIFFDGNVMLLDSSWNVSQYEKPPSLQGKIVHLIGTIKPWHARYAKKFADSYYRDTIHTTFFDTLGRTAYRGQFPRYLFGFGATLESIGAKIPTKDMVMRKLNQLVRNQR